jgi:hypothetical protein
MHPPTRPTPTGTLDVNATESGTNGTDVSASPFPSGTSRKHSTKSRAGCTLPQSNASCLSLRQHIRLRGCAREKSSPSSRRTPTSCELTTGSLKCPPSGTASKTTKPQVAVRTSVATALKGRYRPTPTVPGHRLVDPLMAATAPAAPAPTVRSSLTVILAAEAATVGALTMGLAGEPGAEATAAAEATRTATPPALHVAASTPA